MNLDLLGGQAVVRQAHKDLRDIYTAAIVAARNFSIRAQADRSAEAMGLARDATRVRQALEGLQQENERRSQ